MVRTIVIGCGGAGCNTVSRIENEATSIVKMNAGSNRSDVQISMAKGDVDGCRGDPDLGWALAYDSKEDIKNAIEHYDNIIVTAGLGGGTGSGAIPVIAECAREENMKLVSVVSIPMPFEVTRRTRALLQMKAVIEVSDRTILFDIGRMPEMGGGAMRISSAIASADEMMKEVIVRVKSMLNGPFFSLLSEKAYTVAYSLGSDPVRTVIRAMDAPLFKTDLNCGKIIVTSDSSISRSESGALTQEVCSRTGIVPDVVPGDTDGDHGILLFIPISSRSELS